MKNRRLKIGIKKLREIGWANWDPIGLNSYGEEWRDSGFEDEYDTYLMQAAGRLVRGEDADRVALYLQDIEENYMGLGDGGSRSQSGAMDTVKAIQNHLDELK